MLPKWTNKPFWFEEVENVDNECNASQNEGNDSEHVSLWLEFATAVALDFKVPVCATSKIYKRHAER